MRTVLLLLAAIAISTAINVTILSHRQNSSSASMQPAFDRLVKTNVMRCGYAVATPWFMVDPKTGEKSGYAHDVTLRVAEKIGATVDWVEETGWGVAEAGLQAGRYDVMCGTVCVDPRRNRAALYTTPFKHVPLLPVVRADDHRFDTSIDAINDPSVRIGVKNGHVFEFTAKERFPKAQRVYLNDITDDTEFLQMLESHKIDVALSGQITVDLYEKTNPGKIRSLDKPARYCNGAFMVNLGEYNLQQMLNNALTELNAAGELELIAAKYMPLAPKYIRLPDEQFKH